ncbi:MAG TPA: ABC transporter ATP-binding protein [Pyrinomonadaceae bacterium]|nr:ABC transporter ATP-binding protein [Pyrinomonadaceae bacterium]
MLEIRELKKTYPSGVQALKGITLEIPAGMFGLLGANGAGKTTLMKIAATLLEPDSGHVRLDDVDFIADTRAARRMLGYLPQEFGLYPTLTAEQTLDYLARLKGVTDGRERTRLVDALLERVNLSTARGQKVGGFSGGMRQRLGIAQALIGQPRLIIVDEPTAGLDPEERVRFHNLLSEIAGEETVVILSTHIVSDVSNLCTRMAIMRQGEIIASCTPQEAIGRIAGALWEAALPREKVAALKKTRLRIISTQVAGAQVRVRVYANEGRPGDEFSPAVPSLEDYYFSLAARPENVN